ncbi:hypothetical protein CANCADRAFT_26166 [Tortispora caseinolytica NRRL Y-17796]|uniref:Major facilitator superfamily (MFS) profile domain-containing protein n=1 Tax=Tortispora caseinolytica NRRL Y-17796 TaxID=767744 RepID=A0A1E4THV4_9ASCO|nr:hypothetical protein CANCADRAFT_26166 [Tortispora caseinolytica NRRL Y-17796]
MFLLTLVASFSGFLFGYDTGYISGALVSIGTDLGKSLSYSDKELITASTALGALIGGIIAGFTTDMLGRKRIIMFANILFVVGAAVQTGAHTVWTMIVGRFIMGWGVGLASLIAPLYISELSPSRFRGRLVVLNVLAITSGQVIAYAIGAGLTHVENGWRILVALSIIPAVAQFILFFFMPETPRYLVRSGNISAAESIIRRTYRNVSEAEVARKIKLLQEFNLDTSKGRTRLSRLWYNYKALHTLPSNFRALFIACSLQAIQQFCGFNSLMYFSATIFEGVGFANSTAVSLIVAGTNFIFTCVAFTLIDHLGRRRMLLCTLWGMCAGLVLCAIAFHFIPFSLDGNAPALEGSQHTWGIIVIIAMIIYVAFYASGIGNVPWQQSELFPMAVRGVGTGLSTATNWAGNLVVSATFLTMLRNITPTGTFAFFAALCAVSEVLVYFIYPETAGLPLEEIHELLSDGFHIKEANKRQRERKRSSRSAD